MLDRILPPVIVSGLLAAFAVIGAQRGLYTGRGVEADPLNEFLPVEWSHQIWFLIFAWLGASLVHVTSALFRTNKLGRIYISPIVFSSWTSLLLGLHLILSLVWILTWGRVSLTPSVILHFFRVITAGLALHSFARKLWRSTSYLATYSLADLWAYRLLALNALALLAAWTLFTFLPAVSSALTHSHLVTARVASFVTIILFTLIIAVWTPLDLLLWDCESRYMVAHYFGTIWALIGVSVRLVRFNLPDRTINVYNDTLLCIVIVVFIARTIICFNRHKISPILVKV